LGFGCEFFVKVVLKMFYFYTVLKFLSWLAANVWLFAVAGIGGFKNGAQRNVKADLL
jgi:hypothetical protein